MTPLRKWPIVTVFEIFKKISIVRALIVSQNSFVRHNFWASIVWSTILIRILPNFVLMLMSRFWYIVVSSLCLWKSRKQALSHCSLSTHAQNLCSKLMRALRSRDVTKRRKQNKFLETTSGHFSHLILVFFFLENHIGCICSRDKDGSGSLSARAILSNKDCVQPP